MSFSNKIYKRVSIMLAAVFMFSLFSHLPLSIKAMAEYDSDEVVILQDDFEDVTPGTYKKPIHDWVSTDPLIFTKGDSQNKSTFVSNKKMVKPLPIIKSGLVTVEARVKNGESTNATISLVGSGGYAVNFVFSKWIMNIIDNEYISVGGPTSPDVWYYLRFVIDMDKKTVKIFYGDSLDSLQALKYSGESIFRFSSIATTISSITCSGLGVDDITIKYKGKPLEPTSKAPINPGIDESNPEKVGQLLADMLDFSKPGTEKIKQAADNEDYKGVLKEYSRLLLNKLRAKSLGQMNWHLSYTAPAIMESADLMVGRLTEEDYKTKFKRSSTGWDDKYGINGTPGKNVPIKWIVDGDDMQSYARFDIFNNLVSSYWAKNDKIYFDKWFEIVNDFCVNQKRQVEMLGVQSNCNWTTDAGSALAQGHRVYNIIAQLAILSKSISSDKPVDWMEILNTYMKPISDDELEMFPAIEVANIAISLVRDHLYALANAYIEKRWAPNQRFTGLKALTFISNIFSEFKNSSQIQNDANVGLDDYTKSAYLKDGSFLEQSYNYNFGELEEIKSFGLLYKDDNIKPSWLINMTNAPENFNKHGFALANTLGGLPRVASYTPPQAPKVWTSTEIAENYKNILLKDKQSFVKPAPLPFNSVALPYTGYYTMRTGWDMVNDMNLKLLSPFRQSGHGSPNVNSIELTAYGRKLIVTGNLPYYGTSFLPDPSLIPEMKQIEEYFGEWSGYKNSNVIVNGFSQMSVNKNMYVETSAPDTPKNGKWHTSDRFDFAEGLWEGGYGVNSWWNLKKNIDYTTHLRQVLFVKDAGVWIVNDTMQRVNPDKAEYTQIWGIPPYNNKKPYNDTPPFNDPSYAGSGFSDKQVVLDDANHCVKTQDPEGPNLFMYNFAGANKSLKYEKFYGVKGEKYLGWFTDGSFFSPLIPKVDIHIKWTDEANVATGKPDAKPLITLLAPSKDINSPIVSIKELSDPEQNKPSGLEMVSKNGTKVSYLAGVNAQRLTLGDVTTTGQMLVLTSHPDDKITHGVVLGCVDMTVDGKAVEIDYQNFEFEIVDGKLSNIIPIKTPTMFEWVGSKGLVKEVDSITKDCVVLLINSSKAKVGEIIKQVDETNEKVTPIIVDDSTLVPVRFISESFGAKVNWNAETSGIDVALGGHIVKMKLESKVINVDGNDVQMNVAPQSINGRTLVPLRALTEALGKKVFWEKRGLIVIGDKIDELEGNRALNNLINMLY